MNLNTLIVYVSETQHFRADLLDPTTGYGLTFTKETEVNRWLAKCDMGYYQNQLNFAVYCATTLSGLPVKYSETSPKTNESDLVKCVYRFHFYYQVRKILKQLEVPLPTDKVFNQWKNNFNHTEFERLCNEFRVSTTKDFRTKKGDNNGLGSIYWNGDKIHGNGFIEHRNHFALPDKHYSFSDSLRIAKIQRIVQDDSGWEYFIGSKESNLTQPGMVRLNDSIRTYIYCILGAQAEARTAIVGSFGTELDAQKQFKSLLEDSINQHPDIPTSIARYQKAIADTKTRLDYVIAPGLYIIGSDMILKIGSIENYNNNILIASKGMKSGKNEINDLKHTSPPLMKGTSSKKSVLKTVDPVSKAPTNLTPKVEPKPHREMKTHEITTHEMTTHEMTTHENIKFTIFAFGGALVTAALYFR